MPARYELRHVRQPPRLVSRRARRPEARALDPAPGQATRVRAALGRLPGCPPPGPRAVHEHQANPAPAPQEPRRASGRHDPAQVGGAPRCRAAPTCTWNVIITRTYLQSTIPGELYEAARVDGASNTRMFWHIVLPLSGPIIAVITLFYAVNHWNTYFNALIYIRDDSLRPLQLVLREILIQNSMNILDDMMADMTAEQLEQMTRREFLVALLQYSLIVVATVPVLIMYPFVQKHFIKGVMIGSLKG